MKIALKYKLIVAGSLVAVAALSLYAGNRIFSEEAYPTTEWVKPEVKVIEVKANTNSSKAKKIKLALLLDTSNSMDGLIEQAKTQLWTIVNELAAARFDSMKPDIQIALYEYGNDGLSSEKGYIRQVVPLTDDLDKISEELFGLTTNGGDEYCGHVIQSALKQLDWSEDEGDLQVMFIAGNESFYQGGVSSNEACEEAKRKNIIVNSIFCGNFQEGLSMGWKSGADLASGNYMSIDQNSKTVFIPSPYDDQITQLNSQLNNTYVEYGRQGKVKKESQNMQDANAASYSKTTEVNRAVSKSTHIYKNKSWDMVDAAEDKSFDITKIDNAQLPDAMKNMTDEQKKNYVEQKRSEREKIKAEILALSRKREAYINEQKKINGKEENMLDKSMLNAIRKQATEKNFSF